MEQKENKTQKQWMAKRKQRLSTGQLYIGTQLTVIMTACTRSMQLQTRSNLSMKLGIKFHPYPQCCWQFLPVRKGKISFVYEYIAPVKLSMLQWRPHIWKYFHSTNWSFWEKRKEVRMNGWGSRVTLRKTWEGVNKIKTHHMKVSKLIKRVFF